MEKGWLARGCSSSSCDSWRSLRWVRNTLMHASDAPSNSRRLWPPVLVAAGRTCTTPARSRAVVHLSARSCPVGAHCLTHTVEVSEAKECEVCEKVVEDVRKAVYKKLPSEFCWRSLRPCLPPCWCIHAPPLRADDGWMDRGRQRVRPHLSSTSRRSCTRIASSKRLRPSTRSKLCTPPTILLTSHRPVPSGRLGRLDQGADLLRLCCV